MYSGYEENMLTSISYLGLHQPPTNRRWHEVLSKTPLDSSSARCSAETSMHEYCAKERPEVNVSVYIVVLFIDHSPGPSRPMHSDDHSLCRQSALSAEISHRSETLLLSSHPPKTNNVRSPPHAAPLHVHIGLQYIPATRSEERQWVVKSVQNCTTMDQL